MRRAIREDIPVLVRLMADFYGEAGYTLDRERASAAFSAILDDQRLGYVWIIESEGHDVGHLVLTLKFAMEYGGLVACLDDLYVQADWRNKGLSTTALAEVCRFCEQSGIRALTVEVGHHNHPAQKVYRRLGFTEPPDRQLLTLPLAAPAHVV